MADSMTAFSTMDFVNNFDFIWKMLYEYLECIKRQQRDHALVWAEYTMLIMSSSSQNYLPNCDVKP